MHFAPSGLLRTTLVNNKRYQKAFSRHTPSHHGLVDAAPDGASPAVLGASTGSLRSPMA